MQVVKKLSTDHLNLNDDVTGFHYFNAYTNGKSAGRLQRSSWVESWCPTNLPDCLSSGVHRFGTNSMNMPRSLDARGDSAPVVLHYCNFSKDAWVAWVVLTTCDLWLPVGPQVPNALQGPRDPR